MVRAFPFRLAGHWSDALVRAHPKGSWLGACTQPWVHFCFVFVQDEMNACLCQTLTRGQEEATSSRVVLSSASGAVIGIIVMLIMVSAGRHLYRRCSSSPSSPRSTRLHQLGSLSPGNGAAPVLWTIVLGGTTIRQFPGRAACQRSRTAMVLTGKQGRHARVEIFQSYLRGLFP
jgi:hypothetical protein